MVYPLEPVCWQRHCKVGDVPQIIVLKLASIKDSKQESAQDGMKFVMLEVSVKSETEVEENVVVLEDKAVVVMAGVASTTRGIVVVVAVREAHSSSSLSRLLTAILGNRIYLPDDNDNNNHQHINRRTCLTSQRKSSRRA